MTSFSVRACAELWVDFIVTNDTISQKTRSEAEGGRNRDV